MAIDWREMCRAKDLSVDNAEVTVMFPDARSHRVTVTDAGEEILMSAIVVRRSTVLERGQSLQLDMWMRNRVVNLVGFRIDERDRLVSESWVPKAGLTAEEFQFLLRAVAIEADRYEYSLTGRDVE